MIGAMGTGTTKRSWPAGPVAWRDRRGGGAGAAARAAERRRRRTHVIQISSTKNTSIKIAKGKPRTIKTNVPFYEIVIGDPEIANVNPLTDNSFYVLGNNLGTTGIALFDENKQLVGTVDIEVTLDTDRLASTIRNSVPGGEHRGQSANGRLVLSGSAKDAGRRRQGDEDRHRVSPARRRSSIRSTSRPRSRSSSMSASSRSTARSARSSAPRSRASLYSGRRRASHSTRIRSLKQRAGRRRSSARCCPTAWSIDVAIKALEDRGVARRLAEPNLIARSGREGELPGRRRVSDPGLRRTRPDHRRVQEVRRQPRFHADRAARRADQPRDRAGGFVGRPVGFLSRSATSRSRASSCGAHRPRST